MSTPTHQTLQLAHVLSYEGVVEIYFVTALASHRLPPTATRQSNCNLIAAIAHPWPHKTASTCTRQPKEPRWGFHILHSRHCSLHSRHSRLPACYNGWKPAHAILAGSPRCDNPQGVLAAMNNKGRLENDLVRSSSRL